MRSFTWMASGMLACGLAGAGVALLAQGAMKPGHERVRRTGAVAVYERGGDSDGIEQAGSQARCIADGWCLRLCEGKAVGVVRRRMTGPQLAITHPRP